MRSVRSKSWLQGIEVNLLEDLGCQLSQGQGGGAQGAQEPCRGITWRDMALRTVSSQRLLVMEWIDSLGAASDEKALRKAQLRPTEAMRTAVEVGS